jgi:hypothetical protein
LHNLLIYLRSLLQPLAAGAKNSELSRSIEKLLPVRYGGFKVAGDEVVPTDPTADEVCGFLDSLEQAKDPIARVRDAISAEISIGCRNRAG